MSVTVSSNVVRDVEQAAQVLELASIVLGEVKLQEEEDRRIIEGVGRMLDRLFLWKEDLLE